MKSIDLIIPTGAVFSDDGLYRYALWRVWSKVKPLLLFIGLNPSKANWISNDPTITRMMIRAAANKFGGLLAANLYALVSTDPNVLLDNDQAIGPETDEYLRKMISMTKDGQVLCGWGSFPAAKLRAPHVLNLIPKPYCLGINADGQPQHPLYVGYNVQMVRYDPVLKVTRER